MKRPVVALVIAGLLVAAAGSTAVAKTMRMEVVGTASPVAMPDPGTTTTHGTIVVTRGFRDALQSDPAVTNNPYVTGYQEDVVNWVGDLRTNRGVLRGREPIGRRPIPTGRGAARSSAYSTTSRAAFGRARASATARGR